MCPPVFLAHSSNHSIMPGAPRFGKFIIQAVRISYNHTIKTAYGTLPTQGLPYGGGREKFLARWREDAADPARDLAGDPEAGSRFARKTDRSLRQGAAAHRCRPHRLRLRAAL